MKYAISEVVKLSNGKWLVQFPHGTQTYNTKKLAMLWSEQLKRDVLSKMFKEA